MFHILQITTQLNLLTVRVHSPLDYDIFNKIGKI
jgi:hypothetical protein